MRRLTNCSVASLLGIALLALLYAQGLGSNDEGSATVRGASNLTHDSPIGDTLNSEEPITISRSPMGRPEMEDRISVQGRVEWPPGYDNGIELEVLIVGKEESSIRKRVFLSPHQDWVALDFPHQAGFLFSVKIFSDGWASQHWDELLLSENGVLDFGTLVLERGAVIRMRMVDTGGGPVAGVLLYMSISQSESLEGNNNGWYFRSDENGLAASEFSLPFGIYEVDVRFEKFVLLSSSSIMFEQGDSVQTLRFAEGTSLQGQCVFSDGGFAQGVEITVWNPALPTSFCSITDDFGRFEVYFETLEHVKNIHLGKL